VHRSLLVAVGIGEQPVSAGLPSAHHPTWHVAVGEMSGKTSGRDAPSCSISLSRYRVGLGGEIPLRSDCASLICIIRLTHRPGPTGT
jgi:hypothetical protein